MAERLSALRANSPRRSFFYIFPKDTGAYVLPSLQQCLRSASVTKSSVMFLEGSQSVTHMSTTELHFQTHPPGRTMDLYLHTKLHLSQAYKSRPAIFVPDSTAAAFPLHCPPTIIPVYSARRIHTQGRASTSTHQRLSLHTTDIASPSPIGLHLSSTQHDLQRGSNRYHRRYFHARNSGQAYKATRYNG